MQDEDLPLLVPDLDRAQFLLTGQLGIQPLLKLSLENVSPLDLLDELGPFLLLLLLVLVLLLYAPALLPVQFLLDLPTDTDQLPVLEDALGQFVQELLLGGRLEVLAGVRFEAGN